MPAPPSANTTPPPPPADPPATSRRRSFSASFRRRTSSLTSTHALVEPADSDATPRNAKAFKAKKPPKASVTQKIKGSSALLGLNASHGRSNSTLGSPTHDTTSENEHTPTLPHIRRISLDVRNVLGNLRSRSRAGSRVDVSTAATVGPSEGDVAGPVSSGWEMVDSPVMTSFSGASTRCGDTNSTRGTTTSSYSTSSQCGPSQPPVIPSFHFISSPSPPSSHSQESGSSPGTSPLEASSSRLTVSSTPSSTAHDTCSSDNAVFRASDDNSSPPLPSLEASTAELDVRSPINGGRASQPLRSMPRLASYGPQGGTGLGITEQEPYSEEHDSEDDEGGDADDDEDITHTTTTDVNVDSVGEDDTDYASADEGPACAAALRQIPSGALAGPSDSPPTGNTPPMARMTREGAPSTLNGLGTPLNAIDTSRSSNNAMPTTTVTPRPNYDWIAFPAVTPTPMHSHRLPLHPIASYFDIPSTTQSPFVKPPQTPGDRARALFLGPSMTLSPPLPTSTPRSPERLGAIRPRTQSVMLTPAAVDTPRLRSMLSPFMNETIASPRLSGYLTAPSSDKPGLMRRQSMYELRSGSPPPYMDSFVDPRGRQCQILPREDEGMEALPRYSCSVHLEGWMPRKMEFKSPGVQAKDRAWKKQYFVLHGTMIRVYRSDPHLQPIAGEEVLLEDLTSATIGQTEPVVLSEKAKRKKEGSRPLHFHEGQYGAVHSSSLREVAASHLTSHHNSLVRVYSLQNAESGLAADYMKRKHVVRVRAEGEQFLLAATDDRGVIDLIEALQAATNVSLDLDQRPLPKFITLPRRRRRRRRPEGSSTTSPGTAATTTATSASANRTSGHTDANSSHPISSSGRSSSGLVPLSGGPNNSLVTAGDRMTEMLAEEQDAYMQRPSASVV